MAEDKGDNATDTQAYLEHKKFRVGLILFWAYIIGYGLFVIEGTFNRTILSARLAGLNLGIIAGMTLIVSAILIAITYNWYAAKLEHHLGGK
jgi:uncharacterized membrane protein (DUF485 family)